jgi:hypothetical protein
MFMPAMGGCCPLCAKSGRVTRHHRSACFFMMFSGKG